LIKEGHSADERESMSSVDPDGFYLYRNCIYNIQVNDKARYAALLIDIRPDTLIFPSHFNPAVAKKYNQSFDTLMLHYKAITKLSLVADRSFGMYTSISMRNYNIIRIRFSRSEKLASFHHLTMKPMRLMGSQWNFLLWELTRVIH
jgi:hypothetical protein